MHIIKVNNTQPWTWERFILQPLSPEFSILETITSLALSILTCGILPAYLYYVACQKEKLKIFDDKNRYRATSRHKPNQNRDSLAQVQQVSNSRLFHSQKKRREPLSEFNDYKNSSSTSFLQSSLIKKPAVNELAELNVDEIIKAHTTIQAWDKWFNNLPSGEANDVFFNKILNKLASESRIGEIICVSTYYDETHQQGAALSNVIETLQTYNTINSKDLLNILKSVKSQYWKNEIALRICIHFNDINDFIFLLEQTTDKHTKKTKHEMKE